MPLLCRKMSYPCPAVKGKMVPRPNFRTPQNTEIRCPSRQSTSREVSNENWKKVSRPCGFIPVDCLGSGTCLEQRGSHGGGLLRVSATDAGRTGQDGGSAATEP